MEKDDVKIPIKGWQLNREISTGHLLTTAAILIAGFWWAAAIETRVAVLETQQHVTGRDLADIKDSLLRIEDKIDRKMDK